MLRTLSDLLSALFHKPLLMLDVQFLQIVLSHSLLLRSSSNLQPLHTNLTKPHSVNLSCRVCERSALLQSDLRRRSEVDDAL